jgi:DNA mismatch repair protein MutS2
VFLRHGQGTGALRDAIRKELARSAYVARFGAADPDQGGEGVTVVWLA